MLDKTEVMVVPFEDKDVEEPVRMYMGEKLLKAVRKETI